jgi:hypothetical protein
MQVPYIERLLGTATARIDRGNFIHYLWTEPHAYIQATTGPDDRTVEALAITARRTSFKPTFFRGHVISSDWGTLEVTLGKTTMAAVYGLPMWVRGTVGARRFSYFEGHYFGNPGHYQTFVYGISDAGRSTSDTNAVLLSLLHDNGRDISIGRAGHDDRDAVQGYVGRDEVAAARRKMTINTFTTIRDHKLANPVSGKLVFDADSDFVRLIPDSDLRSRLATWRRSFWTRWHRRGNR